MKTGCSECFYYKQYHAKPVNYTQDDLNNVIKLQAALRNFKTSLQKKIDQKRGLLV